MKNKTILITGGTGFLGKNLVRKLQQMDNRVIATGYSEAGIKGFERKHGVDVPHYSLDISDDYTMLTNILRKHDVDTVIHAAALKHVGICEDNPTRAIDVNVVGSRNVLRAASECGVNNMVAISTDKAINPLCVYGMTKKLMEEMFLERGHGVFQGVNFLFSSESVLDIWDKLRLKNEAILVNTHAVRYFSTVDEIGDRIVSQMGLPGRFSVEECHRITISTLQKAYSTYHDYWNVDEYTPRDIEKVEEELPIQSMKVLTPPVSEVAQLLDEHYQREATL
tara:strand:+ start:9139 stop:9978 length:840 start_codon:yes stop_codon:yes gene_type:complete